MFHNIIKLFSEVGKSWTGSHYPSTGSVEVHSRGNSITGVGFKWGHADEVRKKSAKRLCYLPVESNYDKLARQHCRGIYSKRHYLILNVNILSIACNLHDNIENSEQFFYDMYIHHCYSFKCS